MAGYLDYFTGNAQAQAGDWGGTLTQSVSQLMPNLATAGLSDLYYAYKKASSPQYNDASLLEKAAIFGDRAVDIGGTVDNVTKNVGEMLPQSVRNIAPAAGGVIGGIVGSYVPVIGTAIGAGIGTAIGGKLKGTSYAGNAIQSGIVTGAGYASQGAGTLISDFASQLISEGAGTAVEAGMPTAALAEPVVEAPVTNFATNPALMEGFTGGVEAGAMNATAAPVFSGMDATIMSKAPDAIYSNMLQGQSAYQPGVTSQINITPKMVNQTVIAENMKPAAGIDWVEMTKEAAKIGKKLTEQTEATPEQTPMQSMQGGNAVEITPEFVQAKRIQSTNLSSASKPKSLYPDWTFNTKKAWSKGLDLASLMKLQDWKKQGGMQNGMA